MDVIEVDRLGMIMTPYELQVLISELQALLDQHAVKFDDWAYDLD